MWQQLQMEMGYSQGGHIVAGPWLLSCMLVELLCRCASPLVILEREGKCWSVFPPPRLRPAMFHGPVSLELIICTGLNLVCPGPAITHSACLHGSRYVIRAGLLSLPSSCAGCTGASCWGLHFLLGDLVGLTMGSLRPPRQHYPHQVRALIEVALSSHQSMIIAALLDPSSEVP